MHATHQGTGAVIFCAVCALGPGNSHAHARWLLDGIIKPRDPSTELTTAPCGGIARTTTPTTLTPGQTIDVEWEETVDHPGYFVISFSPSGDSNFEQYILAPRIVDTQNNTPTPHLYQAQITLPDLACTDCTLQLVQVMEDNPLSPVRYYSCSDIQLAADPGGPPAPITNARATPSPDGMQLTWRAPPGASTLVLMDTSQISARVESGTRYTVNQRIGTAQIIYQGTGTSVTLPTLTQGVTYYLMLLAFDNQLRYAAPVFATAMLTPSAANTAPTVTLILTQRGQPVTQVTPDGGQVVVRAQVRDPDKDDSFTYDWSQTDNRLVDLDEQLHTVRFTPRTLPVGTYVARVTVKDDGIPPASTAAFREIVVTTTPAVTPPPPASPPPSSPPPATPPPGTLSPGTPTPVDSGAKSESGNDGGGEFAGSVLGLLGFVGWRLQRFAIRKKSNQTPDNKSFTAAS